MYSADQKIIPPAPYKRFVFIVSVLLIAALGVYWWWQHQEKDIAAITQESISTPLLPSVGSRQVSETEKTAITILMNFAIAAMSNVSIDDIKFYGIVKDQNNDPVENALVEYSGGRSALASGSGSASVRTDKNGLFIARATGQTLDIKSITKEGYQVQINGGNRTFWGGGRGGQPRWKDYSDKKSPYNFKSWKVGKYEEVAVSEEEIWRFERNQTYTLDLRGEKGNRKFQGLHDGDIRVLCSADEKSWKIKISVVDGGLQESSDQYMNLAPEGGYQSFFEYSGEKTENDDFKKKYYFRSNNGRNYGVLNVEFRPYSRENSSSIVMSYTINLEGGRELAVRPK